MTEKELHRLRRQDLLQLLLSQSKEVARMQSSVNELEERNKELRETNERLKAKLDDKDALIEKLKGRLDRKDAAILELRTKLDPNFDPVSVLSGMNEDDWNSRT